MLAIMAAMAVAAQTSTPMSIPPGAPPPIVSTSAPPPPIVAPIIATRRPPRPTIRVSVRIVAASEVLLNDSFWLSHQPASVNETRREALGPECPGARGTLDRSLHFQLMPWTDETNSRYRAEVRWLRPVKTGCEVGSRTASIEQMIQLAPGQSIVLEGDAGLRLELTREQ